MTTTTNVTNIFFSFVLQKINWIDKWETISQTYRIRTTHCVRTHIKRNIFVLLNWTTTNFEIIFTREMMCRKYSTSKCVHHRFTCSRSWLFHRKYLGKFFDFFFNFYFLLPKLLQIIRFSTISTTSLHKIGESLRKEMLLLSC